MGVVGFFGGYKYGQGKTTGIPGNRQINFLGGPAGATGATRRFGTTGNNFVNGTILSKDESGITVQTRGGLPGSATSTTGSKIVIVSNNTQIFKAVQGTSADLTVGENVTVTGTDNPAGALTAQTIQVRQMPPAGQPNVFMGN